MRGPVADELLTSLAAVLERGEAVVVHEHHSEQHFGNESIKLAWPNWSLIIERDRGIVSADVHLRGHTTLTRGAATSLCIACRALGAECREIDLDTASGIASCVLAHAAALSEAFAEDARDAFVQRIQECIREIDP